MPPFPDPWLRLEYSHPRGWKQKVISEIRMFCGKSCFSTHRRGWVGQPISMLGWDRLTSFRSAKQYLFEMSEHNFGGLDNKASFDSLELSFPQNAPGNDKKKFQLPILSNVGKVFQDFYSLAPTYHRRGSTLKHQSTGWAVDFLFAEARSAVLRAQMSQLKLRKCVRIATSKQSNPPKVL